MSGTTNVGQTDLEFRVLGVSDDGKNLIVENAQTIEIRKHLKEAGIVTVLVYSNKTKETSRDR